MENNLKIQLNDLHNTLDQKLKELSSLRNEFFKCQKFDIADNIYDFERNIHNLMQCICTQLNNINNANWTRDSA